MLRPTDDLRVDRIRPLIPPAILTEELPVTDAASETVAVGREAIARIVHGLDDRLVLIVGPCSIHDPDAGRTYGERLREVAREVEDALVVVMRVYFEKPRSTIGWKGLINDPDLDGTFRINDGLRKARRLLLDLAEMGLPTGCEFLDPITPQFHADLVAWGAIGARTSESQVHRELASGLSMPVGFKNPTHGGLQVAIDAVRASAYPHHFLSVTKQSVAAIVATRGNRDCHVILRGGSQGANYDEASIGKAAGMLEKAELPPRLMVDCSHGNSAKDYLRQPEVARDLARQVERGSPYIFGAMMESFLVEGRQDHAPGRELTYGQSITDACMSWEMTEPLLHELARAARRRRSRGR